MSRKKKMSVDSNLEGGAHSNPRGAPPLPPMERRRTQPEFMTQLASKMAERRKMEEPLNETLEGPFITEGQKDDDSEHLTSDEGSLGNLSNDSYPQGDGVKRGVAPEETPPILGSPLRSRGTMKPRGVPPPLPPPKPVAEATPSSKVPPPVSNKPKKSVVKQPEPGGDDEVDFGGVVERKGRSTSLVRQELEEAESSITAALKDQAGNRLGR